jgi:hypothetical protein
MESQMNDVSLITISLNPPYPESGMVTTIVRLTGQDKSNIDRAADFLGMTKATLMRILLVKGAGSILSELGVTVEYEQNDHVDLSRGEKLIE